MAWTTPRTYVTSEVVTAAILNTDHRDNLNFLYAPPSARVYNSAAISIPTAPGTTTITFNSERYDTDGMHSTSVNTSRLTCVTAGKYAISGHVRFDSNSTGDRYIYLTVNGLTIAEHDTQAINDTCSLSISTIYPLSVGHYVELKVAQSSGGALNVRADAPASPELSACWISS